MNKTPPTSKPVSATASAKPLPPASEPAFAEPRFEGERSESIIPPDVKHLIFVTGHRGKGKTTFGLGVDDPNNILMLDYEAKGEGLAVPLGVGSYHSVLDDCVEVFGFGYRAIHIYQRTKQILEAMPQGRFTTLLLDNGGILQDACRAEVERAPRAYGVDPEKAFSGAYGGAWPGVKFILKALFHLARSKGIEVIVVTFQPTGAWKDGKPLFNKFKTTDVGVWHEMSVLTLVLVDGLPEHVPAPSALVIKEQLAALTWNKETRTMDVQRRLPLKLPLASPSEVYRYLREPADLRHPKPGETPEQGEVDQWSVTFSKDQLKQIERLVAAAQILEGPAEEGKDEG